jgi:HEAT repeat protein
MLENEDELMRASACFALGEIQDESSIDRIVSLIQDDFWVVNRNAIDALKKMGNKTISFIENKLKTEKNSDNLIKLIFALGEIGDMNSLGTIMKYINHENGEIRAEAENAIEKIKDRN